MATPAEIQASLDAAQAQAEQIKSSLGTLSQAEQKGLQVGSTTSVQEAQQFLGLPDKINTTNLGAGAQPVTIPTVPAATAAAGLSGLASGVKETTKSAFQQQLDAQAQQAQTAKEQSQNDLVGTMQSILDVQGSQAKLEEEAGLAEKAQKVTDYTNQLEALERAELNEVRALDNQPGTLAQKAAAQREIQRRYAFEKADVALLQSAANRDYDTAQRIVDRKIELALEPLKLKLDFQRFFYEENKDAFDKAEQRAFQNIIAENERAYNEQKSVEKYKADTIMTALQNGIQIPGYVMNELNRAESIRDVAETLARNGVSLIDPLKILQMENIRSQIKERESVGGVKLTASQSQSLGYGERLVQASQVIDEVGGGFTGFTSRIAGSRFFPQGLKSDDRQRFEQAQRNFINAVLRRESGAAIAPSEFKSAALQYFPQPGDSQAVLIQKKQNRDLVARNLLREAGVDTTIQEMALLDPLGLGIFVEDNPLGL